MRGKRIRVGLAAALAAALAVAGCLGAPAGGQQHSSPERYAADAVQAPSPLVSVIVQFSGSTAPAEQWIAATGGRVTRRWSVIDGLAAELPAAAVPGLMTTAGVRWVSPDAGMQAAANAKTVDDSHLFSSYPVSVGAEWAWQKGYDGAGVTVAVLDSGINFSPADPNQDLRRRVVAQARFHPGSDYMSDKYGHGTHVAGIIAGDGYSSRGKYIGIAPASSIVNLKISDDFGATTEKHLVDALDWVYLNKVKYGIRIVNISSTSSVAQSYATSPLCAAVERLWFNGVVVVVSAGNRGDVAEATHHPPANDPYVITVGAVDDQGTKTLGDDLLAPWSSYGTTQDGFVKPDVVAPGNRIVSMLASGSSVLVEMYPKNKVNDAYFRLGGTSMAAPVVSGVIALLLQARPDLTPDQVKHIITHTWRSYYGQPEGQPGVVSTPSAVKMALEGKYGQANQGLTPAEAYDPGSDTLTWGTVHWATVHWATSSDF